MYDLIVIPSVFLIVAFFLYKFFELLICRKERRMIIERIDSASLLDYVRAVGLLAGNSQPADVPCRRYAAAWPLRIGAVLVGLGLGSVVGRVLVEEVLVDRNFGYEVSVGCVLFFGGLGLLVAFIVEYKLYNKRHDGGDAGTDAGRTE